MTRIASASTVPGMSKLYDVPVKRADGSTTNLGEYKDKVLLVVNVASQCGLTPQYKALEDVYEKYRERGFVVVGFPCNDFGAQEPGTAEEIHTFCETSFGIKFPILDKITVAPANRHPLYRELIAEQPVREADPNSDFLAKLAGYGIKVEHDEDIAWNFEKFLVDRKGNAIARFAPDVTPDSALVTKAIEASL
jgi:glutathione peroxidase